MMHPPVATNDSPLALIQSVTPIQKGDLQGPSKLAISAVVPTLVLRTLLTVELCLLGYSLLLTLRGSSGWVPVRTRS